MKKTLINSSAHLSAPFSPVSAYGFLDLAFRIQNDIRGSVCVWAFIILILSDTESGEEERFRSTIIILHSAFLILH